MKENPLISCLCITKNSTALLNRAITCFLAQTYPNKELLVVYESDNIAMVQLINRYAQHANIKFIEIPASPKKSLGELRNLSIALCSGDYFSQWDDDDWYAGNRLQVQMDALKKDDATACFLGYWILYDNTTQQSFLSFRRNWEGTILCKKEVVNENCRYDLVPKLEDTPFKDKIEQLYKVSQLVNPQCYFYTYHGNNTYEYAHFVRNFNHGYALSDAFNALARDILHEKYTTDAATEILYSNSYAAEIGEALIKVDAKTF